MALGEAGLHRDRRGLRGGALADLSGERVGRERGVGHGPAGKDSDPAYWVTSAVGATARSVPSVSSRDPCGSGSNRRTVEFGSMVADAVMRYGVTASGEVSRCSTGRLPPEGTVWATIARGQPNPRDRASSPGCEGDSAGELAPRPGCTESRRDRAAAAVSAGPV